MKSNLTNVADCTVPEKILLAALELEEQGQSPFSAEALIVAAWQKFPKTFGLKGYAELYPDSNKVLSSIMGVRGLAGRGWLAKMGQKLYVLTRDGRQLVRRLLSDGTTPPAEEPVKITREQEKFLNGLWGTTAIEKFNEGRKTRDHLRRGLQLLGRQRGDARRCGRTPVSTTFAPSWPPWSDC